MSFLYGLDPHYLIALIPIGFFVLLFCVALFERRHTRPFVRIDQLIAGNTVLYDPAGLLDPSGISDYVELMSRDADASGFEFGGVLAHAKIPQVRILATVWLSPDRRVLVLSGSGTVLKMPRYQTWLFTPLQSGHVLVTTDNTDEGDPSRISRTKRVLNVRFHSLLEAHARSMAKHSDGIAAFAEATPSDALFALYDRRLQVMVNRGLARHLDSDHVYWHYTVRGALLVCAGFFPQLGNALLQFWRVNKKPIASPELKIARPRTPV